MIKREIITVSRVATTGKSGNIRLLGWNRDTEFCRIVMSGETVLDCVNRTFEIYGLDTTDIDKIVECLEDDGERITIRYRLEVDPLSILEFLVSDEGRISGLELIDLEN